MSESIESEPADVPASAPDPTAEPAGTAHAPSSVPADTKDWTWVITSACAQCGFDPSTVTHADISPRIDAYVAALVTALSRPDVRSRPRPDVWSPLEYACHVRDVCLRFAERVELMLEVDDPRFDNWDQDATAEQQRYWAAQPEQVSDQLRSAADTIAAAFGAVREDEWDRPGRRSNGSVFTVSSLATYFLHDLAHHAWDVTGHSA